MASNKTIKLVFTRATYGDEGEVTPGTDFIGVGSVATLKEERALFFINRGKARPFSEEDEAKAKKKPAKSGEGTSPAPPAA